MGSVEKIVERMKYWVSDAANLGYDQSNRWDIRVNGECDCSSLVIFVLKEAGFSVGGASYTGNLSSNLVNNGWTRITYTTGMKLIPGDLLLNDANHVAVYIGDNKVAEAAIDENNNVRGGISGDQTHQETRIRNFYNYPWNAVMRYETKAVFTTADVIVWPYHGKDNQKWKVVQDGPYYRFESKAHPGFFLDVSNNGTVAGTKLILWADNNGMNQKFKLVDPLPGKGHKYIEPSYTFGLRVDVCGGVTARQGAKVELWAANTSCAQKFYLIEDDEGYVSILFVNASGLYAFDVCGG